MLDLETAAFSIWRSVLMGKTPETDDLAATASLTWSELQALFFSHRPYKEFKTDETEALFAQTGVKLAAVGALSDAGFDPPYWLPRDTRLKALHGPDAGRDQRRSVTDAAGRLQDAMLIDRALVMVSPFDGTTRRSTASFVMDFRRSEGLRAVGNQTVYFFNDGAPLFVLFGGEDNWPMEWYDPLANIAIRERGFIEISRFFSYAIAQLQTIFVRNPHEVMAYLNGVAPRKTAAWVGSVDYISTHYYLDVCGLDRAVESGAAGAADHILVPAREVFGPIQDLYPELDGARIERISPPDVEALNLELMARNIFTVRLAEGFARTGASSRILNHCRGIADPEFAARLSALRALGKPILFVALRLHNRRWLRQPEEIAAMLNRVSAAIGGLSIIFDGYAVSKADPVPLDIMAVETEFIDRLKTALAPSIACEMSAGRSLADCLLAAEMSDAHLSTQGTTTTKAVLIADLPGVVIGPDSFWWLSEDYRAKRVPNITLGPGVAVDVDAKNWPVTDFDLPTATVEASLTDILAPLCQRNLPPNWVSGSLKAILGLFGITR